ncbi:MAG: ATP-binding protein [Chitinophagales bacterium]|nr:ATP-binding protein [Chitinophagales bacterium]MDW8419557.1 ATP-binding protein [Chitinophagales bacterium]
MIIQRHLTEIVRKRARKMPIIAITGPRQSGKTTLAKQAFPDYRFISLETTDSRAYAQNDPRGFLEEYGPRLVIDEAQYVPQLFSHIQDMVDLSGKTGQYVLTGSQNFKLSSSISQSLAGRVAAFTLLPFSIDELRQAGKMKKDLWTILHRGFYPRLYSRRLQPSEWLPDYTRDYIERDVRNLKNIGNLMDFRKFMKLCASRAGHIVNFSSIGNEVGVSYQTIKQWMSILEASYIIFLLPAYHRNFSKRIVKSPKIYFYDVGLLCSLLEIDTVKELQRSPLRGQIFENFLVAEFLKNAFHRADNRTFYFWRDNTGNEIDLVFEKGNKIHLYEIKLSATMSETLLRNLWLFDKLNTGEHTRKTLIYTGPYRHTYKYVNIVPWHSDTLFAF